MQTYTETTVMTDEEANDLFTITTTIYYDFVAEDNDSLSLYVQKITVSGMLPYSSFDYFLSPDKTSSTSKKYWENVSNPIQSGTASTNPTINVDKTLILSKYKNGFTYLHFTANYIGEYTSDQFGASLLINMSPKAYDVIFYANGGTNSPESQKKLYSKTLTLTTDVPTRENYIFKNWNTSVNEIGTSYDPGATYTSNANLTLYAIWKRTITMHKSYNVDDTVTVDEVSFVSIPMRTFSRSGWKISRWNNAADGSGDFDVFPDLGGNFYYPADEPSREMWPIWIRNIDEFEIGEADAYRCEADFLPVSNPSGNPYSQHYYERFGEEYKRVSTSETSVVSGKDYFLPTPKTNNNGEYIESDDSEFVVVEVPVRYKGAAGFTAAMSVDSYWIDPNYDNPDPTVPAEYKHRRHGATQSIPDYLCDLIDSSWVYEQVQQDTRLDNSGVYYDDAYRPRTSVDDSALVNYKFVAFFTDMSANIQYYIDVIVTATDTSNQSSVVQLQRARSFVLPVAFYTIDFKAGGHSVSFGAAAKYVGFNVSMTQYVYENPALPICVMASAPAQEDVLWLDISDGMVLKYYDDSLTTPAWVPIPSVWG